MLPANASGQLDVLWHDGNSFGVDGTQVGVFKLAKKIGLRCLLQCQDCPTGKVQSPFQVLGNLPHQTLKWEPPDQQLGRLLISMNFSEGHHTQPVSLGFLLSCRLCCALLLKRLGLFGLPRQQFMFVQPCRIIGHRHLQILPLMLQINC